MLGNDAKKKTNEKNNKREKTFMREEEEETEEEEYESLFRVKREFPDDFLSFRNELRKAYPGCVVPKLFRRPVDATMRRRTNKNNNLEESY